MYFSIASAFCKLHSNIYLLIIYSSPFCFTAVRYCFWMPRPEAKPSYTLPLCAVLPFPGLVEQYPPVTTPKVTLACVEVGYKIEKF